VAGIDRFPADVVRPAPPDVEHVEPLLELILPAPQRQHRAGDLAPAGEVQLVQFPVERRPGAVVLAHRVDRLGIPNGLEVVRQRLRVEAVAMPEVVRVGIGPDDFLRERVRLREEVPVPVHEAELHVRPPPHLQRRDDVQHRQLLDAVRMVQREAVGAAPAPIVARE